MTNEPESERGGVWGWVVVLGIAATIVVWGILQFLFVSDVPRDWSYGSVPETPASSVYSTEPTPGNTHVPLQIQPLPEAKPLQKEEARP